MGRSRPSDDGSDFRAPPRSVEIELEGFGPGATVPSQPNPTTSVAAPRRLVRLAAILGIGVVAVLSSTVLFSSRPAQPDAAAEKSDEEATGSVLGPAQATIAAPPSVDDFLEQLPNTAEAIVENLLFAWIDETGVLRVRSLADGSELPIGILAERNLPPLPGRIHLLSATNATWLLDLEEPERSGKLSNQVRMVRFGQQLDSYGFISTGDNETSFFVGSLWGPSMQGTATVPASTEVYAIANTGIVVASQAASSGIITGAGIEALPSRLGRIVAAGPTRIVGIHCDDLGRCIGRVANWDGSDEIEIDVTALASPVVRISPDGRFIIAAGSDTWTLYDLLEGRTDSWTMRVSGNGSLTWTPDSSGVFFVEGEALLAISVADPTRSLSRVRSAGSIGPRLPDSDAAVLSFDME